MSKLIALGLVPALVAACGSPAATSGGDGPRVVATFYPLAFVAERVAGGHAGVANLTPPGAEAHDIELTASQVVDLAEADLVIFLGGGFQPSIEELAADLGEAALDVSEGREMLPPTGDEHDEEDAEEHDEEAFDPHVWLDPTRLAGIAEVTGERLAEADPGNAGAYRENARALVEELDELDREFSGDLADCASREIVTSHESFGYLAARYDLTQVGISGLDPEAEPSPQRVAEVSDFVEEHGVTTVFFETLVSPEIAETIAQETGAATAKLDPLESAPDEGDYLSAMRTNLDALKLALGCS